MLELARRHPDTKFLWYGEGELLEPMRAKVRELDLKNAVFPGAIQAAELADAFRRAHVFVLPSLAEGVPKVTQEAAACGLAQVVFGYYEAFSVIDGQNGFVVWDTESFFEKVDLLLGNPSLCKTMGDRGAQMALDWSWDALAPRWEQQVLELLRPSLKNGG